MDDLITALASVAVGVALTLITQDAAHRLQLYQLKRRWKAAYDNTDHRLTILPSWCTCCPIHDIPSEPDAS